MIPHGNWDCGHKGWTVPAVGSTLKHRYPPQESQDLPNAEASDALRVCRLIGVCVYACAKNHFLPIQQDGLGLQGMVLVGGMLQGGLL